MKKSTALPTVLALCTGIVLASMAPPATAAAPPATSQSGQQSSGVQFDMEPVPGTGHARVTLYGGTVRHAGDEIEILDQYGAVTEKIPLELVLNDGTSRIAVAPVSRTEFDVITSAPALMTRAKKKKQGWEGSWDKCVSEAGLQGAGAGLLLGVGMSALGMVGNGITAALLHCRNLPHKG
jgi:hypothetical protein